MCAAPVSIAVFEFLDNTHQEIQSQIKLLHALVDAIENEGLNQANRARARRVLDYFNGEARQHHLDEEKHIFPALLVSQDAEIVQATEHLIQDHGWLEENWIQIAPSLEAATGGTSGSTQRNCARRWMFWKRSTWTTSCLRSPSPTRKRKSGLPPSTPPAWVAKWPSAAPSSTMRSVRGPEPHP